MIRLAIGVILGACFSLVGLVVFGASVDVLDRHGTTEDFWAALLIGVTLILLGIFIIVISFKARNKRNAVARQRQVQHDRGEAEGVMIGMGMAHMMNSEDFETDADDGGDFGD